MDEKKSSFTKQNFKKLILEVRKYIKVLETLNL